MVTGVDAEAGGAAVPAGIRRADVALVLAVACVGATSTLPSLAQGPNLRQVALIAAGALLAAAPVARSRARPVHVLALLTLALALYTVADPGRLEVVLPMELGVALGRTAMIGIAAAVYMVARHRPPGLVAAAVGVTSLVLPLATAGAALELGDPVPPDVVAGLILLLQAALFPLLLAGHLLRRRATRAEQRAARAARALAAERARIARELHGLVLADLSRIAERAENPGSDVRGALLDITASGRAGLTSMRRLLGMLRGDDRGTAEPQPTLDGLDGLVAGFRDGGLDVALTVSGAPRPLPDEVGLAVYRLVQETLLGAEPGGAVTLTLSYEDGAVRLVADGDVHRADGITAREWVRLIGGRMRLRRGGRAALEVYLPERSVGAA